MPDLRTLTSTVLLEHAAFSEYVEDIKDRLEPMHRREMLQRAVDQLIDKARMHFQAEERCGLFELLKKALPEEAQSIDKLVRGHGGLDMALTMLRQELDAEFLEQKRLVYLFRAFTLALHQHEAEEDRLLLDALARKVKEDDQEAD